jgi:hypothetical protein
MQEEGKGGPKKTVVATATPVPTNNNNNASANTHTHTQHTLQKVIHKKQTKQWQPQHRPSSVLVARPPHRLPVRTVLIINMCVGFFYVCAIS